MWSRAIAAWTSTGLLGTLVVALGAAAPSPRPSVSFDRDIRPILTEHCLPCHGPDQGTRQGGLRLDTRDAATRRAASGVAAIVPGDPVASTVMHRIDSHPSTSGHMPPRGKGRPLSKNQRDMLRRWIADGARYEAHWAFVPPRDAAAPRTNGKKDPIDAFLEQRIERAGLTPTGEADRPTLIRRLSFDLVGLPPTPQEVDDYVADRRPDATARLVDRLLASPHFGERMAIGWLDLARYADTHGYHIDSHRDMFRWRDWVIDAFNRNLPYDQFITEQIAGDLLPNPTLDQRIATGFNRNHPINFEGGAIPEEYRNAYVADRVDTTATAFLGLTLRCAQCHDHKVEPFSQKDYYRFYAFFNNVDEEGLDGMRGNAKPMIPAPTAAQTQQLADLRKRLDALDRDRENLSRRLTEQSSGKQHWMASARETLDSLTTHRLAADKFPSADSPGLRILQGNPIDLTGSGSTAEAGMSYGGWVRLDSTAQNQTILSRMDASDGLRGWDLFVAAGGRPMVHLIHRWPENALRVDGLDPLPTGRWVHLWVSWNGRPDPNGVRIFVDGKSVATRSEVNSLKGSIATERPVRAGGRWPGSDFTGSVAGLRVLKQPTNESFVAFIAALTQDAKGESPAAFAAARQWWLETNDSRYPELIRERDQVAESMRKLEASIPTTMVMQERTGGRRQTHVLVRGQYDRPTAQVEAGLPEIFGASLSGRPVGDRRDIARWMTSESNPLVARVAVNRLWQHFFGTGIVATSENFGMQGERPSHPELLDHLAISYRRSGWDTKALVRRIVLTEAYRRSSRRSQEAARIDPANRLLSHAPRLRLPAELIRDQALASSGLLVPTIGGPSVKPYQPPGLWEEMSFKGDFTAQFYEQDHGEKLWRRSLYTFWKRTVPPPSLQTFDAPEREFCIVRRAPTNTPLQALVTLNDPTYVEAARQLAARVLRIGRHDTGRIAEILFRLVLGRQPSSVEVTQLRSLANREFSTYRKDPASARSVIGIGEYPVDPGLDPMELAAWTSVALAVFNLDEALHRG